MQRIFAENMKEMRGLIADSRSASLVISSGRSESRDLYLLAVSGGIDSMCLADLWLRCFGPESFAIAHCNFHLRGEESDGDEALVTKWAEENGVRMHRIDFDTVGHASENGLSIEMAARELRYRWFGELCLEHGYVAVVVAHHADDNAETFVLNMVRGAGIKGLTGMRPVSPLPYHGSLYVLRPMLTFSRKQIEGHAFAWKVPYREDSTNSSVEYRRNSIRHEVFPLLERMNPSFVRTINREMTYLSDASSIVEDWCRAQLPKVIVAPSSEISIPRLLAIPQWRYLLYYILEPYGFNSSVLESLENLLMSDRTISGKRFESDEYVLRTERQSLVVLPKMAGRAGHDIDVPGHDAVIPDIIGNPVVTISASGTYRLGTSVIEVELLPWTENMPLKQPRGVVIMDADKFSFPFVIRRWKAGDWLVPLGMKGKKKVSDLFTDLKYDTFQKENAVILSDIREDGGENQRRVAAVVGVRIDDRYRVTSSTVSVLRITCAI